MPWQDLLLPILARACLFTALRLSICRQQLWLWTATPRRHLKTFDDCFTERIRCHSSSFPFLLSTARLYLSLSCDDNQRDNLPAVFQQLRLFGFLIDDGSCFLWVDSVGPLAPGSGGLIRSVANRPESTSTSRCNVRRSESPRMPGFKILEEHSDLGVD